MEEATTKATKKPMSKMEMGRFGRKRDADFRKIENALDQKYIFSKLKASAEIKKIFLDEKFREYYLKLKELAGDDGIIEVAAMAAKGDNGFGYYDVSMVLNMANFEYMKYSELLFIGVQYKPADMDSYACEITELHGRDMSNFLPRTYFLDLLKRFTNPETAVLELKKLATRTSILCCNDRTHFVTE